MKKIYIVIIILLVLLGMTSLYYKWQVSNNFPFIKDDCNIRCDNNSLVDCSSNEDCKTSSIVRFCEPGEPVFINGLTGYCEKGHCQSYGCNGAPSIK